MSRFAALTAAVERLRADVWLVPVLLWGPLMLLAVVAGVVAARSPDPLALAVGLVLGAYLAWVADITRYLARLLRMPSPARLARLELAGGFFAHVPLAPDVCPACGNGLQVVGAEPTPFFERALCQFRCEGPKGHGWMERAEALYTELHFDRWPDGDQPRASTFTEHLGKAAGMNGFHQAPESSGPTLEVTDSREQARRELASSQFAAWTVAKPDIGREERVALAVADADALLAGLEAIGAAG